MGLSIKANRNKLLVGLTALLLGTSALAANNESVQSDQELATRVKTALHANPYFYDKHVNVSVQNGQVVLHGFVTSSEDKENAVRIATQAAGGRKVIDDLSIKESGRR